MQDRDLVVHKLCELAKNLDSVRKISGRYCLFIQATGLFDPKVSLDTEIFKEMFPDPTMVNGGEFADTYVDGVCFMALGSKEDIYGTV